MTRRTVPRAVLVLASVTLVVSIIGFVGSLVLNAFVFDKYDAYGEVPIPGKASLTLPAGEVTIAFHTVAIGNPSGALPIPNLQMNLAGPDGERPEVTESIGATTSVNNDIRRRVWVAHIRADGIYQVETHGAVGAFINPTLAFGHGSSYGRLPWLFAALFAASVLALVVAIVWSSRLKRVSAVQDSVGLGAPWNFEVPASSSEPGRSYVPTDDGVRIQALKTLAALRDSGALTEDEFQWEKRRLLDGR